MARDPSQAQQSASHARTASPTIELTQKHRPSYSSGNTRGSTSFSPDGRGRGSPHCCSISAPRPEAPGRARPHRRRGGQCPRSDHPCLLWVWPGYHTRESAAPRPEKKQLYRNLQALIIDEISMVRADLLDCIDQFLRVNGPRAGAPFGGVQLLFIGDLYQLPPVVLPEEETLFTTHYASPYFFDAHVLRTTPYTVIQLTKVYRQQDATFVTLLDAVRTGSVDQQQLATLNARYRVDVAA